MNFLDYLQRANQTTASAEAMPIALATNFTDDIFKKIFEGVCAYHNTSVSITKVPYKQYAFALKDPTSDLWRGQSKLTFFFFDCNFFITSEFADDPDFFAELLADIRRYALKSLSTVVIANFILPFDGPLGGKIVETSLFQALLSYNEQCAALAAELGNVHVFDTNRLAQSFGLLRARDLRGLYAFDTPFTNDFLVLSAEEWFSYIRALAGKSKKVIVLDLDNTLWGGVVGEVGPLGIAVGLGYPGAAFQNFQRALLHYYNSGILLVINSKNNLADVLEVFEKNPHMILQKEHFAAIYANWQQKSDNMLAIAQQLNLNPESFIFFDDDPLQRELLQNQLPEVLVPNMSVPPEEYARVLHGLAVFSPFPTTAEDKEKTQQYAEERQRREISAESGDLASFIENLSISVTVSINDQDHIPRISQLTMKTNQCNVTTKRYTEKEIADCMATGLVFDASIEDRFGNYGLTAVAIVTLSEDGPLLDSFLMSCRVLGRGVEFSFFDTVVRNLCRRMPDAVLKAEFVPTGKNIPAANFFTDFGFKELTKSSDGKVFFELDCAAYCLTKNPQVKDTITINR